MNRLEQKLGGGVFQDDAPSTELKGLHDLLFFRGGREENDADRTRAGVGAEVAQGVQAGVLWHGEVEQENVGLDLGGQFHRFKAVASFAYDLHIFLGFEQTPQTVAENWMIVGDDDADGTSLSIHGWSFVREECGPPRGPHDPGSILS